VAAVSIQRADIGDARPGCRRYHRAGNGHRDFLAHAVRSLRRCATDPAFPPGVAEHRIFERRLARHWHLSHFAADTASATFSYNGAHGIAAAFNAEYSRLATLGQSLAPYTSVQAGGGITYRIAGGVHVQLRYDYRQYSTQYLFYKSTPTASASEWHIALATRLWQSGSVDTRRILLVEDEPQLSVLLEKHLKRLGFDVDTHQTGGAALSAIGTGEAYDLVIADMGLPDMRGEELLTKIFELHPALPVLICSGSEFFVTSLPEELQRRVGFLQKPFAPKELGPKIDEVLGR
jgi:CheY-like chemotaxis protein